MAFNPKEATLVGLSMGLTKNGSIAVDIDCVSSIAALKKTLDTTVPNWDGHETLCDMVQYLKEELTEVQEKFMERYKHETIHLS